MSHSTHVGFSEPPAATSKLSPPSPCLSPLPLAFWAFGVGHICTTLPSSPFIGILLQPCAEPSFQSRLVGVGHILANRSSDTDLFVAKFQRLR